MAKIQIRGDIISNDMKWIYDWFEYDSTCPDDVRQILDEADPNEPIEVYINSGGGDVFAGQEIYSLLAGNKNTVAIIQSIAGSAAGVAAMGAHKVTAYPVAMLMIHNVSVSGASGDYHDMEKCTRSLIEANEAMASAYTAKTGKELDEILDLMDKETWLTAEKAVGYGFVDEVIKDEPTITNAFGCMAVTDAMIKEAKQAKEQMETSKNLKDELLKDLDLYGV